MNSISYEELWYSGAISQAAIKANTIPQLAGILGVTVDALASGLARLRKKDPSIPKLSELMKAPKPVSKIELDTDVDKAAKASSKKQKAIEEMLAPEEEHRLKKKLRDSEKKNKELMDRVIVAEDRLAMITEAMSNRISPITPTEITSGLREGTAVFLISDLHLEEEVKPEKVNFMNKFNLDIARKRMTKLFEGIRWFIETQRQSFKIRTACIWLGGDMFTNYLHDDNKESNLLAPPAAFAFAKRLITDGLKFVLEDEELERLVVPCNDGNHGRLSKDLRATTRAEMSLENLMYGLIADELKSDPRVEFEIAQGDQLYTQIYNMTVRWTHGAEVKGGGGIGGISVPLYRALSRWQTVRHADLTCLGHFHQRLSLRDIEMNGSLIGYSPYAMRIAARFEEPTQSAFMIDSKRGKSICAPLWVADSDE